jgi:acetyl-CoA acyltransferase
MVEDHKAYIVAIKRAPVLRVKGREDRLRPDDLLAQVIDGLLQTVSLDDTAQIEDVIIGCAMPEAEQGMNVARLAAALAGLPYAVPGLVVNRWCASGLEAIALACQRVQSGVSEVLLAGGVESMSLVPMGGHVFRPNLAFLEPKARNLHGYLHPMGQTAERLAHDYQISRSRQDAFALQSHQRAVLAQENKYFNAEIVPIQVHKRAIIRGKIQEKAITLAQDQGPRDDTSLEALAQLKPAFNIAGTVTAGNSSQMSDGAAVALIMSGRRLKALGLTPMACFCGYQVVGVAPEIMGIGPVTAINKLLARAQVTLAQVGWIELNEAFAAQSLVVMDELHLDEKIVNPYGGAIALGHPLGATGAIRTATALHAALLNKQRYALVSMCVGGGMGAAGLFELML